MTKTSTHGFGGSVAYSGKAYQRTCLIACGVYVFSHIASSYNTSTLIGNWNEQRFDINRTSKLKPIPSQYSHYFETTYGSGYNTVDTSKVPEALKHLEAREPIAFPAHQPELDPPRLKKQCNTFLTTSRAAFGDPNKEK
ncbi:UPF0686 protein C11orf1 homolog [Acropora millepora]|uniref:UPF0686 protein C11orf1 homolog n=1 Tax=Acropora millepora TaxID=45264 RepID=UPI001CF41030|nr:UPF0686 protein C11orf1 homolog [Acropora millepora]